MNEFSPVLSIPSASLSVVETRPVGSVLTQIAATDQDNVVGNLVSKTESCRNTLLSLYNTPSYNMDLDITLSCRGSQVY